MTWSKFEFESSSSSSCQKKWNKKNNSFSILCNENQKNNCNIMVDSRVRRGSTFASPLSTIKEQKLRTTIQRFEKREKSEEKHVSKSSSPPPVSGRSHIDIQTEPYIENLSIMLEVVDSTMRDGELSSATDFKIQETVSLTSEISRLNIRSDSKLPGPEEISKVETSVEKTNIQKENTTTTISDECDYNIEYNDNRETESFAQEFLASIRKEKIESMEKAGYFD